MITALQFSVLVGYLIIVYRKFGILQSISHSTYKWQKKDKYYFTTMCVMLGVLNLFQGMGAWGIFTTFGLLLVGFTVNFLDDNPPGSYDLELHTTGAVLSITAPFIGLFALHGIYEPFAVFLLSLVAILKLSKKNFVWWIEISAFALILISYALR